MSLALLVWILLGAAAVTTVVLIVMVYKSDVASGLPTSKRKRLIGLIDGMPVYRREDE